MNSVSKTSDVVLAVGRILATGRAKLLFALALVTASIFATPASANTCSWWSPYDGLTYSGVDLTLPSGGTYFDNPIVVLDFWGSYWTSGSGPSDEQMIGSQNVQMLSNLSYWVRFSQYGISSGSVYKNSYFIDQTDLNNTTITDSDIQSRIVSSVQNGRLPYYGQYIYVLLLPPDVHYGHCCDSNGNLIIDTSGYGRHGAFSYNGVLMPYATIEYGNATVTPAHEVMEAATDPTVGGAISGFTAGYDSAQPTTGGAPSPEIGDLCNGRPVVLDPYTGIQTQQSWFQDLCSCGRFGSYQTWYNGSFFGSTNFIGDVTGIGRSDVIAYINGNIDVIRSNGAGFNTAEEWWAGTLTGTHGTLMGNVDGGSNQQADIIALNDSDVTVIRSTGNIPTSSPPPSGTGFGPVEVWSGGAFYGSHGTLVGDVNDDQNDDLVALGDGYVGVILSTGLSPGSANPPPTGTGFGAYQTAWSGSFYGSYGTFLADVDGDRRADLVALGDGYVGVIRSQPASTCSNGTVCFGPYETWSSQTFYGTHGTFLKDIDGDGRADLVALNDGSVTVLHARGAETLSYQDSQGNTISTTYPAPRFTDPETWWGGAFYGVAGGVSGTTTAYGLFADVTGDHYPDLVALGSGYVGEVTAWGN